MIKKLALAIVFISIVPVGEANTDDSENTPAKLSVNLCGIMGASGAEIAKASYNLMKKHVQIILGKPSVENWEIVHYLNQHRDEMTCGKGKDQKNDMMAAIQ